MRNPFEVQRSSFLYFQVGDVMAVFFCTFAYSKSNVLRLWNVQYLLRCEDEYSLLVARPLFSVCHTRFEVAYQIDLSYQTSLEFRAKHDRHPSLVPKTHSRVDLDRRCQPFHSALAGSRSGLRRCTTSALSKIRSCVRRKLKLHRSVPSICNCHSTSSGPSSGTLWGRI